MSFLFFSAEATSPSGYLLMEAIKPIEKMFLEQFSSKQYTPNLDDITIVFVCFLRSAGTEDWFKDRRYVSHKKRYADIRLNIDYDTFLQADFDGRLKLMWKTIVLAIEYVATRVPTLKKDELLKDIDFCFKNCYPNSKR